MVKGRRFGYVLVSIIFLLGMVVGGGGMLAWSQESHAAVLGQGKTFQRYRLRALSRKLDLDHDQRQRIAGILEDDAEVSQALGQDMVQRCGQRLQDHKREVDTEIRSVLRPDQQRRFELLVEERRGHVTARP